MGIINATLSCRKTSLFGRRFKEYLGVKGRGSLVENIYLYLNLFCVTVCLAEVGLNIVSEVLDFDN